MNQPVLIIVAGFLLSISIAWGDDFVVAEVEAQPVFANAKRLIEAMQYLGSPLPTATIEQINKHAKSGDAKALQRTIDKQVLAVVSINPELRVKVERGEATPTLQQGGFSACIVKVINQGLVTRKLAIQSPQAGPIYSGSALNSLKRQSQTELKKNENVKGDSRFLEVEMFNKAPMTSRLSGLKVEYQIALIYSGQAGRREATLVFDIGQGTQDLGFRSELAVLFTIRKAIPVTLKILDHDGSPTTARLEFRDPEGRIFPPQARRLAPDFFFQPHIYRSDGDKVLLPPGKLTLISNRGPEYLRQTQTIQIEADKPNTVRVQLKRWVDPMKFGYYGGDHHIHGAGCSHYDNPTQGVSPGDMFAQVKGEGLNVGCVLTWGPCFDYQRRFFSPVADEVSEPKTLLKYDLEISGFGSAALGHVCLLDLKNQTYPGSEGTKTQGWPSWTAPVMRWTKEQGGVTGYPHSALHVVPESSTGRLLQILDSDNSKTISKKEAANGLLPESFATIDADGDGQLTTRELTMSNDRVSHELPNVALPALNGGGAMEIFVTANEGVCDFISAMDTARIPEWNTWYHLLNCGIPIKLSGETDFPCMSSRRVGQGRVYVQMGDIKELDFSQWCQGLAKGRSYVSDGYAHALAFSVNDISPGDEDLRLDAKTTVNIKAKVAFAPEQPKAVAYGTLKPAAGKRMSGDTVNLHAPRESGFTRGGKRLVEVVVNGKVVETQLVAADGEIHDLNFKVAIKKSSWVAIRQFPQLHTNPVTVLVNDQPIRASRKSALWCVESIRLLWKNRRRFIRENEREAARASYKKAINDYLQRSKDCPDDGSRIVNTKLDDE